MDTVRRIAKAIAAGVTPLVVALVSEIVTDVESALPGIVTAAFTAVAVYLVPNKAPE
jgi:hypothetical protein